MPNSKHKSAVLFQGLFPKLGIGIFDWYIVSFQNEETIFDEILSASFVNLAWYCEDNGLNVGVEDFLATGECNCISNAEAVLNEETKVNSCQCVGDYVFVADFDEETMSVVRKCQMGVEFETVEIAQSMTMGIAWDN